MAGQPIDKPDDEPDLILDLKGLKCPLPVLRTRKALKPLAPGSLVEIETTDPSPASTSRICATRMGMCWCRRSERRPGIGLGCGGVERRRNGGKPPLLQNL